MLNVIMTKSYLQPPQSASLATTIVDVEHATIELGLALPERKVDSTMATRVEMKQRIWPRIILTDTRRRFATFLFYDKLRIEDKYTVVTQFDSFFFPNAVLTCTLIVEIMSTRSVGTKVV